MLTEIGKRAETQGAVGLLLECHERIRKFLALARRIAEPGAAEPDEVREAAARVSRYFAEALPLHATDEDASILPRLRGKEPALDVELEAMAREHGEHGERGSLVRVLAEACDALSRQPERHASLSRAVASASEELGRYFAGHLRREEEIVFPAVRRLLDPGADAEIVREIRARRGATPASGPGSAGPIVKLLAAEHLVLDALLEGALERPGKLDARSFADFRDTLLRHVAIEEEILLPAARDARGGEPIPEASRLRIEHLAITALLGSDPTPELAGEIREILFPHYVLEEGGGVYERCEALLADRAGEILDRVRRLPLGKGPAWAGGLRPCRTAEEALQMAERLPEGR